MWEILRPVTSKWVGIHSNNVKIPEDLQELAEKPIITQQSIQLQRRKGKESVLHIPGVFWLHWEGNHLILGVLWTLSEALLQLLSLQRVQNGNPHGQEGTVGVPENPQQSAQLLTRKLAESHQEFENTMTNIFIFSYQYSLNSEQ